MASSYPLLESGEGGASAPGEGFRRVRVLWHANCVSPGRSEVRSHRSLGAGAELQKPLALAVIGGLALSTPVTLLVVPGLYAAIKGEK